MALVLKEIPEVREVVAVVVRTMRVGAGERVVRQVLLGKAMLAAVDLRNQVSARAVVAVELVRRV